MLRRTVSEIQPFKVLEFELPILTLEWSLKVKGQGEFGKVTYGFLLGPYSNHRRRTHRLRVINDFQLEPFLGYPILTPCGHHSPKTTVDMESGMQFPKTAEFHSSS